MARLVTETLDRLTIVRRPDLLLSGWLLVGMGLLMGAGFALLPLTTGDPETWLAQIGPGVLVLIGVPFWLAGRSRVEVDKGRRTVRVKGRELGPDELGAVVTWTWVKVVQTKNGTQRHEYFSVGLAGRQATAPLMSALDEARRTRGRSRGGAAVDADDALLRAAELAPEPAEAIAVTEHSKPHRVWVTAEALAKALSLPIVDRCGDHVVVRGPDELDVSLPELLARGRLPLEEPGPAPEGLEAERRADALVVRYRTVRRLHWAVMVGVSLAVSAVGLWRLTAGDPGVGVILLVAGSLAWLPLLFVKVGQWRHTITVDRRALRHETEGRPGRAVEVPLAEVELLRVASILKVGLDVVGDRAVHRFPMQAHEAVWIRRVVERWLARRG